MKCKLTVEREVVEFASTGDGRPPKRVAPPELVAQCERRGASLFAPAGTIIEDPQAYMLVLMGVAEAADDECLTMDTRGPEQREAAARALKRLQLGIHPDDFAAFEAGEMLGYDADGKVIPGPNATQVIDDEEEEA